MTIYFTKMHGLGNDFMVIDAINQPLSLTAGQIADLSRRDTGIGFDQCLIVEPSPHQGIDFFYRIFNANGQEVGQCGNGARCLARFIHHYKLSEKKELTVATHSTTMTLIINDDQTVTVNLGQPKLAPVDIPLNAEKKAPFYTIIGNAHTSYNVHALNVGNPHAVMAVDDICQADVNTIGSTISQHPDFPEGVNVGFMQIHAPNHLSLRVFERGCGETRACGSGAVAAAAAGRLFHQMHETIKVTLPGGDLWVNWPNTNGDIFLTGPGVFVYEGTLMN